MAKRKWTKRANGRLMTTLRCPIHLSPEEWEEVERLAQAQGETPENVVAGYVNNFSMYLYDRIQELSS